MIIYTYVALSLFGLVLPHTGPLDNQTNIVKTYLERTLTRRSNEVEKEYILQKFRKQLPANVYQKFRILQSLIYDTSEFERWLNRRTIPKEILEGLSKRIALYDTPTGKAILANRQYFLDHANELKTSKRISNFSSDRITRLSRNYYVLNYHTMLKRMTRELTPIANKIMWKITKGKAPVDQVALNKLNQTTISRMMAEITDRERKGEAGPESLLDELLKTMNLTEQEFSEYLSIPNDSSGLPTHDYLANEFIEFSKYQMNRFLNGL